MKFNYTSRYKRDKEGIKMKPVPLVQYRPETISSKIGKKLNLENKDDWFSSRSPFILANTCQN
jgi:hypothetical protein